MTTEELVKLVEAKEAAMESVRENINKRFLNLKNLVGCINPSESKEFNAEKDSILIEIDNINNRVVKLLQYK